MEQKIVESVTLSDPSYYNNRELSWLGFNKRVLEEAIDVQNPLLERLKFLGIFSSNLDEFFMVRVAGLKDQVRAGFKKPENKAGLTPKQQLDRISAINQEFVKTQYCTLCNILAELEKENIKFLLMRELSKVQMTFLEGLFDEMIFPVLTPLAVDAYHPFPMLLNKSMNLAVVLKKSGMEDVEKFCIVQIPRGFERYIQLPLSDENGTLELVLLEDVISHFLYKLFVGYEVHSITCLRITRNADLTIHEEGARDLLKEIEEELKKRKWGSAVRLEVQSTLLDENILEKLIQDLEIHKKDVYIVDGPVDLTFFYSFYTKMAKEKEHLAFLPIIPQPPRDINSSEDIFEVLDQRDILLHHPYESFDTVIQFIKKAAEDPNVLAIKQTLYRVSKDSPIIKALKIAAENGKQVLVLVELKARFDEEHNIQWAKELEKAGCHVIYGMTHLKTHSKITLIVRSDKGRIQRFVHLGTGNYNDDTARIYTDFGFITSNLDFGVDATHFFNYLSGYTEVPEYVHFKVSPNGIRDHFLNLMDQEIEIHKQFSNGRIIVQMNSLTDKKLIMKLYEASRAGIKIDLIVRGVCCLRPGIEGISENIRVRSIVGRFLEHSRINYFHHNGEEKIFLSSADWMTRNMSNRVEISFPIYDEYLKQRVKNALSLILSDNVKAREQNSYGEYHYVHQSPYESKIDSQNALFSLACSYNLSPSE